MAAPPRAAGSLTSSPWTIPGLSPAAAGLRARFAGSQCAARLRTSGRHRAVAAATPAASPSRRRTGWNCRHPVAAISRVEAAGGVERWSDGGGARPRSRAEPPPPPPPPPRARGRARRREDRPPPGSSLALGIGGSANPGQLKRLHAHTVALCAGQARVRARRSGSPPRSSRSGLEKRRSEGEPMIELK